MKALASSIREGDRFIDDMGQPVWEATGDAVSALDGREVHIPIQYSLDGGRSVRVGGRAWMIDEDRIQRREDVSDLEPRR